VIYRSRPASERAGDNPAPRPIRLPCLVDDKDVLSLVSHLARTRLPLPSKVGDSAIDVCGCIFIHGTRTPPANGAHFVASDKPSGPYIASIGKSHLHIYAFYKRQLRSLGVPGLILRRR